MIILKIYTTNKQNFRIFETIQKLFIDERMRFRKKLSDFWPLLAIFAAKFNLQIITNKFEFKRINSI